MGTGAANEAANKKSSLYVAPSLTAMKFASSIIRKRHSVLCRGEWELTLITGAGDSWQQCKSREAPAG